MILAALSHGPLSRTQLENQFFKKIDGARSIFEASFRHLVHTGRIVKTGTAKRAPYQITERGKRLLEGLV